MNDSKYKGEKHSGPGHSAPYPVSRQSPAIELVELAKTVASADNILSIQAAGKLRIIAEQIDQLQQKAREILTETRQNQDLHRVECSFVKKAGKIYHLYKRDNESLFFSMVDPDEWNMPGQRVTGLRFMGSFRLEQDQTWTRLDSG